MPPPDDVRLRHLVEAARKAIAFTEGRSRDDLENDELLRLAVTKLVEIVGEARLRDEAEVPERALETRIRVAAPVEAAYEYLADLRHVPDYDPPMRSIQPSSPQRWDGSSFSLLPDAEMPLVSGATEPSSGRWWSRREEGAGVGRQQPSE
jgi:uncharacterized protein with HEPN domain